MQVTNGPLPPLPPAALPQDAATRVLPQIQAQAVTPQTARAIDPGSKAPRSTPSRNAKDRAKASETGEQADADKGSGHSVNLSV